MKEILPEIERWQEAGEQVVVATVVGSRRSSPRPVGSSLAISGSGKLCGSVSGGCVEGDVFQEAQEVFESGAPKLLSYGISDEPAARAALALEDDERIAIVLSFGYPAKPRDPESHSVDEWSARAKRRPLQDIVRRR